MEIKTIEKEVKQTHIIEKSKFIAHLFPCDRKSDAQVILENIRKQYIDATHVCYAYIIMEENVVFYKSSDDGEPSSTAGAPILNVLKKNHLTNVLCIIVRYFGGIKLGAGGLTRTYSNCAAAVVMQSNIVILKEAFLYELIFDYENKKEVDRFLDKNSIKINDKVFELKVVYTLFIFDKELFLEAFNKIAYLPVVLKEKQQLMARQVL